MYIASLVFLCLFLTPEITLLPHIDTKVLLLLCSLPFLVLKHSTSPPTLLQKKKHQVFIPLACVMFGYVSLSYIKSDYTYFSTKYYAMFWTTILSFILGVKYGEHDNLRDRIGNIFTLFIAGASLYTIAEFFGYVRDVTLRIFPIEITGHIGHKNVYATMAMISLILGLHLFHTDRKKIRIPIFLITLLGLMLADARGPLILAVGGIFLYLIPILKEKRGKISPKVVLLSLLFFAGLAIIPLYLWQDSIQNRFMGLLTVWKSDTFRIGTFQSLWNMFLDAPVWGHGLGTFPNSGGNYAPEWYRQIYDFTFLSYFGHNEYLERLAELGVIGFSLYFALWVSAVIVAVNKLKRNWGNEYFMVLIVLLQLMLTALFDVSTILAPVNVVLWGCIGVLLSAHIRAEYFVLSINTQKTMKISGGIISIIVVFLFGKIYAADFVYMQSITGSKAQQATGLSTALNIYPNHPYAGFRVVEKAINRGDYDNAAIGCRELLETTPNIFPLYDYLATVFLNKKEYDSAYIYVTKELSLHRKYIESQKTLQQIYSAMGNSQGVDSLYKQFTAIAVRQKAGLMVDEKSLDTDFQKTLGKFRYRIRGPWLWDAYVKKTSQKYDAYIQIQNTADSFKKGKAR